MLRTPPRGKKMQCGLLDCRYDESPKRKRQKLYEERNNLHRDNSMEVASLHQQIAWGKKITASNANVDVILDLFDTHGHRFDPRHIAMSVHRVGLHNSKKRFKNLETDKRMIRLVQACEKNLSEFDNINIVTMLWGISCAKFPAYELFFKTEQVLLSDLERFQSHHLITIVQSFASVNVYAQELFIRIADILMLIIKMDKFDSIGNEVSIAKTAWAFATFNIKAPELYNKLAQVTLKRLDLFDSISLNRIMWAFACIGWSKSDFFYSLTKSIVKDQSLDISHKVRHNLIMLYLQNLESFKDGVSIKFFYISNIELSVQNPQLSAALNRIGWKHQMQYRTPPGVFIPMAQIETKISLQYHTIHDYIVTDETINSSPILNGDALFKEKIFQHLGWTIIHIPYFDWLSLENDYDQEAYLTYIITKKSLSS